MSNTKPTMSAVQEDLIAKQSRILQERLSATINTIHDQLVSTKSSEKSRLPESIFVRDFLPYFSGEVAVTAKDEVIAIWAGVAGSPYAEVTIIDARGDALFDVPPIMVSRSINPTYNTSKTHTSIEDIGAMAESLSKTIPVRGERFFLEAMHERASVIIKGADTGEKVVDTNEQRWLEILRRYNKAPQLTASINANNTNNKSTVTDDDIEFE